MSTLAIILIVAAVVVRALIAYFSMRGQDEGAAPRESARHA